MSKDKITGEDVSDEKVGYRNPPKQHRWQKNQSGNYKGRPPKTRSSASNDPNDVALREAERTIRVRGENGVKDETAYGLTMRRMANDAVNGDPKSQRIFAAEVRQSSKAVQSRRERLFQDAVSYKALAEELLEEGAVSSLRLHPDDFAIDALTRTVTLTKRAEIKKERAKRELRALRLKLKKAHGALSAILPLQPDNKVLLAEISNFQMLLRRIEPLDLS